MPGEAFSLCLVENLSEVCDCDCCDCCDCDGGKTKSTPSLGFWLRLEFDNKKFGFQFHISLCVMLELLESCEVQIKMSYHVSNEK